MASSPTASSPLLSPLPPPSHSFSTDPTTPLKLLITFRFTSTDFPDLTLPLSSPSTTTIRALKTVIRHRRRSLALRRLRLINAGRILPDATLISSLTPLDPPPSSSSAPPEPSRLWIHVSVGQSMSAAELADELRPESVHPPGPLVPPPSTTRAPTGFDRLLAAGFSAPEIAALRDQFERQNPDLAPEELREVEERWIEEGAGTGVEGAGGGGGEGGYGELWWGVFLGFFWPVGVWMLREEGMWSRTRQTAVLAGFGINILFGLVRLSG